MERDSDFSCVQALEQVIIPADRAVPCQDIDPQAFAQLILGTLFSVGLTGWSPVKAQLEERYEPQEPVSVKLLESLYLPIMAPSLARMTAVSPNKRIMIALLSNNSILFHGDACALIPPPKTRIQISYLGQEKYYQKLLKMRPRNAHLHGADLRCPELSPEESVTVCTVSDYGDICLVRENGELAIIDSAEVIPGRPYTYLFVSPFSVLPAQTAVADAATSRVVSYACCFPPDSDNYLQHDSVLLVMRCIGRYTELTVERCMYTCPASTVDNAAFRGGVRREWSLQLLPMIRFQISYDTRCPLSISSFISPFGTFAIIIYSGMHLTIPFLHTNVNMKRAPPPPLLSVQQEPTKVRIGLCGRPGAVPGGCSAMIEQPSASSQLLTGVESQQTVGTSEAITVQPQQRLLLTPGARRQDNRELIPFQCQCNCTQFMPSLDARFNRILAEYMQWIEADNGSCVVTHNLHALIYAFMPHALRQWFSGEAHIAWSLDGAIYCLHYAGLFIFGSIFGIFFHVKLEGTTASITASGPCVSFAELQSSKNISFGFLGGRFLALRFGSTVHIFHLVLPFNRLELIYPERWSSATHVIAAAQLIRELPPAFVYRKMSEFSDDDTFTFVFADSITTIAFLSYTFKDCVHTTKLLSVNTPLEARELQENIGDGLNPQQSSSTVRETGVATEISLFCQLLGMRVSKAVGDMLGVITDALRSRNSEDTCASVSKILSSSFSDMELLAYEAALVPVNILRRRYTKELPVISVVCANKVYQMTLDALSMAFDYDIVSFFYQRLSEYDKVAITVIDTSTDKPVVHLESSDIFSRDEDDLPRGADGTHSTQVAFDATCRYNRALCVSAVSVLKLATLMVRASYTLSSAQYHMTQAPRILSYMDNRLIGYTIAGSTCLAIACGLCCMAYDHCAFLVRSCAESSPVYKDLVQKMVLFLLSVHALAKRLHLYALDGVCAQMMSLLVPHGQKARASAPGLAINSSLVPILPAYIVNMCYQSLQPISLDHCGAYTELQLAQKQGPISSVSVWSEIPQSVVAAYSYMFLDTPLHTIEHPVNPYNNLYRKSLLSAIMSQQKHLLLKDGYSPPAQATATVALRGATPTLSQTLYAAYVAGIRGHFLVTVMYLLKIDSDTDYQPPHADFACKHEMGLRPNACLTRIQCDVLTLLFEISFKLSSHSVLSQEDVDYVLSLRSRTDPVLLDALTFFLVHIHVHNTVPSLNVFRTYQRHAHTGVHCHCGSHRPSSIKCDVVGRIHHALTFPDSTLLDNLPKNIAPLFRSPCIALFLAAIGRVENGAFILARERHYSLAVNLLRSMLSFLPNASPTLQVIKSNAASEKQWLMDVYSCKKQNLERLCTEIETSINVLNRMYGQEAECVSDAMHPAYYEEYVVPIASAVPATTAAPSKPASIALIRQTGKSTQPPISEKATLPALPASRSINPAAIRLNKNPEIGEVVEMPMIEKVGNGDESTLDLDANSQILSLVNSSGIDSPRTSLSRPQPPPLPLSPSLGSSNRLYNPQPQTRAAPPPPPPLPPPTHPSQPNTAQSPFVPVFAPTSAVQPPQAQYGMVPPVYSAFKPQTSAAAPHLLAQPYPSASYAMPSQSSAPLSRAYNRGAPFMPATNLVDPSAPQKKPLAIISASQVRPTATHIPVQPPVSNVPAGLPYNYPQQAGFGFPNVPYNVQPSRPAYPPFSDHCIQNPYAGAGSVPFRPVSQQPQRLPQKPLHSGGLDAGSTLNISDSFYPNAQPHKRTSSMVEGGDRAPSVLVSQISNVSIDLNTHDYRNLHNYLDSVDPVRPYSVETEHAKKPASRHEHKPSKQPKQLNDFRLADISRKIEEIDQLAATAQGTMNYLHELSKEVEGSEKRLFNMK